MGVALKLTTSHVAHAAETEGLQECTANSGDSLDVPSFTTGTVGQILSVVTGGTGAGEARIRSPRLHDQAQGIRLVRREGVDVPYAPPDPPQTLYPQDRLLVEQSGTAGDDGLVSMLQYFGALPGAEAMLRTAAEVAAHTVNITGVLNELSGITATGTYSGSQAINADQDTLKANINYALLGYLTSADLDVVGVTGPDTGNYRVGGPGNSSTRDTSRWFMDLSRYTGMAMVPVINAANAGATTIDAASVEGNAEADVTLILAELNV
ncbi:MAG: hypothetical protein ACRDX8_12890 [Acidimicrobiales bacterium]